MNDSVGWITSSIKCPAPDRYSAIVTDDNVVHIFGEHGHYSLRISAILGDKLYGEYLRSEESLVHGYLRNLKISVEDIIQLCKKYCLLV